MQTATPQEIPFVDLTDLDGRNKVREVSKSRAERLHVIDVSLIKFRPGKRRKSFNVRIQPDGMSDEDYEKKLGIPELAEGIFNSNGPDDVPIGDFKDGFFYLNAGERRTRAIRHLLSTGRDTYPNGSKVSDVEVLQNPKGFTDKERRRRIFSSDSNRKYTVLERAYGYLDMKLDEGMTNEEIADMLNISRQTVDNYILVTELPEDVQQQLENDETKISHALAEHRAKSKRNTKMVEVDVDSGEVLFETLSQEERRKEEEKAAAKVRGDEDEFEQEDNSITGPGSMGGPKEGGSGSIVIGKDTIYMDGLKLNTWKQLVNRYEVLKAKILEESTPENGYADKWEDILAERLKNEYNLTVK